jgi:hypothetical protein
MLIFLIMVTPIVREMTSVPFFHLFTQQIVILLQVIGLVPRNIMSIHTGMGPAFKELIY